MDLAFSVQDVLGGCELFRNHRGSGVQSVRVPCPNTFDIRLLG